MTAAAQSLLPLLHLQTAACGRPSVGTIEAVAAHLRREAAEGGYVAQEQAAPVLRELRAGIGALVGHDADAVRLTFSASDSLERLLRGWPLPAGAEVAVAPAEWGPNRGRFREHSLALRDLAVDADGRVDLEALDRLLRRRPPAVVHLVQLASHRGLEQPVADALALCRAAGVPLWVDAAQALAHRSAATGPDGLGADAVYAPARKWLDAPRGVGFLAVAEPWRAHVPDAGGEEASVASQVGAAHAVSELAADHVAARADVGTRLRAAVSEIPGWQLTDPPGAAGALVGLRPTAGQDVERVQERLHREHRILTTACLPWRAPADMHEPLLRLAPSRLSADDLDRLTTSLTVVK